MAQHSSARTASILISLAGALFNLTIAIHVLALWKSIKWEPESEWEGALDGWKVDSVKLVWGLLSGYFSAAATISLIGFSGIIQNIPSYVRFYRDYFIADFVFSVFSIAFSTYAAYRLPFLTGICEHLSQQPQLTRSMAEMGLNLENCELWFERAVPVFLAVMLILIVLRLHFLVIISKHYKYISRLHRISLPSGASVQSRTRSGSLQRIYILSRPGLSPASSPASSEEDVLVYAPVPLHSLSPKAARDIRSSATEAWISRPSESSAEHHSHRHRHHGLGSNSESAGIGRISLPVSADECLLPEYQDKV